MRLDHEDIKIEDVPPDFVFPEPDWLLPPTTPPPPAEEGASPTPEPASSLLIPPSAGLAGGVFAAAATAAWLGRRTLARRRSFSLRLRRLCDAADLALEEERSLASARQGSSSSSSTSRLRSLGSSSGSLRDRAAEAERQRAALQELVEEGLELGRRYPWEAAWRRRGGEESRRLESCARELSQRLAKVERAAQELGVMAEVEQLLARLAGGSGGVRDGSSSGGGALDDDGSESDDSDGDRGGSAWQRRRNRPQCTPQRARLSTRAALLLSRRPSGSSDNGGGGGGTTARRTDSRCVFREELARWCDRLAEREQEAVDWLKLGLETWDLEMADRALAQLRLLELPEIVQEFEKKREDVRGKRWRLQQELKVGGLEAARSLYLCVHDGAGVLLLFTVWTPRSSLLLSISCSVKQ